MRLTTMGKRLSPTIYTNAEMINVARFDLLLNTRFEAELATDVAWRKLMWRKKDLSNERQL
jgi:hypothetical protein